MSDLGIVVSVKGRLQKKFVKRCVQEILGFFFLLFFPRATLKVPEVPQFTPGLVPPSALVLQSQTYLPLPFNCLFSSGHYRRGCWHHMRAERRVVQWKPAGHTTETR